MFCPNCGEKIPKGSTFCEQCGAKIAEPEAPLSEASQSKSKKVVALAILAIALVSAAAGFFITKQLGNGSDDMTIETTQTENAEAATEPTQSDEDIREAEAASHVIAGRATGRYDSGDDDTLADYKSWVGDGARLIEQDVTLGSDGELYICYMPDQIDWGGRLSLSEVFEQFKGNEDVVFVVELKSTTTGAAKELCDLIEKYGFEDRVIAQCFDPNPLRTVSDRASGAKTMYLVNENNVGNGNPSFDEALDIGYIDIIAVKEEAGFMTSGNCRKVHDSGKEFGAFILRDRDTVKKAIDIGVDYYFISGENLMPSDAIELEKQYR